jgi:hypothetical protein
MALKLIELNYYNLRRRRHHHYHHHRHHRRCRRRRHHHHHHRIYDFPKLQVMKPVPLPVDMFVTCHGLGVRDQATTKCGLPKPHKICRAAAMLQVSLFF